MMKGRKKKRLIETAILFSLIFFFFTFTLSEARVPEISAKSALVISLQDWQPLYDKEIDLRLPMASTTKIMTALLTDEYLEGDEYVLISENAASVQPVKIGLKAGERYKVDDLLYGLLIYSANDAGIALAEKVAGSEERFVELMNQKAREIGAYNTRFNNATGLPGDGQYTTVKDLALILHEALKDQKILKIMQTRFVSIDHNGRNILLRNKNRMLWECPWTVGGKTGFTRMAGYCYVGEFKNGKNGFIIALLGSKKLWSDAKALVDYGNQFLNSPPEMTVVKSSFPQLKKRSKRSHPQRVVSRIDKYPSASRKVLSHISKKRITNKNLRLARQIKKRYTRKKV